MFIIVLGQHVSILTESYSGLSKEQSLNVRQEYNINLGIISIMKRKLLYNFFNVFNFLTLIYTVCN